MITPHRYLNGILGLLFCASFPVFALGQSQAASDNMLPGGTFELGALTGAGIHAGANGLADCIWFGVRIGHRFEPFKSVEKFQAGFRTGIEGCYTDHDGGGRVDMIFVNVMFLNGYRLTGSSMIYWGVGGGELLGDNTPGGGSVQPRPSLYTGPGVTYALTRYLFVDVSVFTVVYENFDLGIEPSHRTTFSVAPNIMLAIQI